jgi:hypothetical protein
MIITGASYQDAVMAIDLGSHQSVRDFASAFRSIAGAPAMLLNSSSQPTTRSSNHQPVLLPKHWYGGRGRVTNNEARASRLWDLGERMVGLG